MTEIGRRLNICRHRVSKTLKEKQISTERNPIKKDIFDKIDTEEKAYWLGFLYADGYINRIQGQVELALQEKDYNHLVKFKKFLGSNTKITYRNKTKAFRFTFCCRQITDSLIKLGCTPRKSLTLNFPTEEQVPRELQRHFMRGYIDGDGSLINTGKTYCLSFVGTKDFIKGAIESFNLKECKLGTAGKAFVWRSGNYTLVQKYLNLFYDDSTIYLERKYEKYKFMIKAVLRRDS